MDKQATSFSISDLAREFGITPRTILKSIEEIMRSTSVADQIGHGDRREETVASALAEGPELLLARLEGEMLAAARALEFEKAASLRDRIDEVRTALALSMGDPDAAPRRTTKGGREPRKMARRFGKDR